MATVAHDFTEDDFADGLLTVAEVAEFCKVCYREVYYMMERDKLQWMKVGRHRKVPRRALLRWLAGSASSTKGGG